MPGTDRGRPWLFDTYLLNVLIKALFFIAAVTVDLLWGYTGYLTFGQSAFFGVGAYAAGLAFTHFGFSPGVAALAVLAAALASAALALVTGWLSLLPGASPFFATVISLVLPIVLTQVALSGGTYTGSSSGLTGYDSFDLSLQAWYVVAAGAAVGGGAAGLDGDAQRCRPHPGGAARRRIALQLPGAGHGALAYRAAGRVRRGGGAGGLRLRRASAAWWRRS